MFVHHTYLKVQVHISETIKLSINYGYVVLISEGVDVIITSAVGTGLGVSVGFGVGIAVGIGVVDNISRSCISSIQLLIQDNKLIILG